MSSRRGNLQPAHQGYRYQDIATAYMLVRGVVERYEEVVVDRKQVDDDRIDDLEVVSAGRRVRRQFKSSQYAQRCLTEADFTATGSTLRFDRLVSTYSRAGSRSADEYRLCATWHPPEAGDSLAGMLELVSAEATIEHWPSQCYRLRGEDVWPEGGKPTWAPLDGYAQPGAELGRCEVIAFCERFIIELSFPLASTVLTEPGPLERALIEELSERVGIGRYPNHGRTPADVAALSISLANLARTQGASFTPAEVERELNIRTDFGRVAQSFPLDESLFHDRPVFRRTLREAALTGVFQLVLAPPGAGKSWELTRLADELRAEGAIVARHYCYLEPGDELVERRVTTDVFFGNLLGELIDAAPELLGAGEARYAAGLSKLEEALAEAASNGRRVVLLVDGLDHIARVLEDSRSLGADDTDIVERLATLEAPAGVAIVIGSQPGQHLDPLRIRWGEKLIERHLPTWSTTDLAALVVRHGAARSLAARGITEDDEVRDVYRALAERADGNPLYARYLTRGLVSGLQDGSITNPHDWIVEAPAIDGDVAVYYAYLYRTASTQAQAIADLLGVIDFAVTEGELREMLPAFVGAWVPHALAHLAPVLTSAAGQGGVRVFHESFRRFMTVELADLGRSPADALEPVIAWLDRRGFFRDAKSYRFLLPALRRAGRSDEALSRVTVTFVSESVAQAHPLDAILRNLALAADIAGRARDWPALVRCVELHRSACICFNGSQNTWHDYWITYLDLFGSAALAERLLFDGRPTQTRGVGLLACSLVDDAGGTAPWLEYLELPDDTDPEYPNTFDENGRLAKDELIDLAVVHGRFCIRKSPRVIGRLLRYLNECGANFKPLFVRMLAARIARMVSPALVERLASRSDPARRGGPRIALQAATSLRLGIADEWARLGDRVSAAAAATLALVGADTPELAAACLSYGAPAESALRATSDPATVPIAVGPDDSLHDADGVRAWVASIRLLSRDLAHGPALLERERNRVAGEGWYRCWLRFVIELAAAESAERAGRMGDVVKAFGELTHDVRPLHGTPRACDLYAIRHVIRETIAWGLSLLHSEAQWRDALHALAVASNGTWSRLDREDGGPLPMSTLMELLMPYAAEPVGGPLVRNLIEQQVARRDAVGTYYPTHAGYAMYLARARYAGGEKAQAYEEWMRGSVYLAAYGWRKDATVFDIIEAAPSLLSRSEGVALQALADAQPLANAVVAHTDGRTTNHAPNAWFRNLLRVHPATAVALLARTISEEDGTGGWQNVEAIRDIAAHVGDKADPALVDAILASLRFEIESEDSSAAAADARLAPIVRLAAVDPVMAAQAIRRVAAEVSSEVRRYTYAAAARVEDIAAELELLVPRIKPSIASQRQARSSGRSRTRINGELCLPGICFPAFPPNPSFVDLLAGLRAAGRTRRWDDLDTWDNVIFALSYHIGHLVDGGREDDARRLLRFFARDTEKSLTGKAHPLGKLASTLDTAGYFHLAAVAYALAYTASRGGMGFLHLGDHTHGHLIERGVALDREAAMQAVADEVSYALRFSWSGVGTSRHLIERIASWGESRVADLAWREAFAVVSHRLPLAPTSGWFARLELTDLPNWTIDESLVALLLARLSDPRLSRKNAALAGFVRAIQKCPDATPRPLHWWLTRNSHVTSVLLVLDALWREEKEPFPASQELEEVLVGYSRCALWGAQQLAALLLDRIGRPAISGARSGSTQGSNEHVPSPLGLAALSRADVGETLKKLRPVWPELPELVARRFDRMLLGAENRNRAGERYRLQRGSDGDSFPFTPVLLWESELFETALHDQMTGLSAYLWSTGQWTADLESSLMRTLLPHTALHLGWTASRTARPAWPKPAVLSDGLGALPVLADDDPAFTGWMRLATVELQYLSNPERPYGRPTEAVNLFSGAIAVPLGTTIPSGDFPFEEGDVNDWWRPEPVPGIFPPVLPLGRLVQWAHITDWMGDAWVLIPPLALRSYIQLEPPGYGEPLIWRDSRGAPAIALRTWWVLNEHARDAEPVECKGSDLVARPDMIERLGRLCRVPVRELRAVRRRPISVRERAD